tara:strand:+ start:43 stop:933 length:891 start_codon:yes stop_codon:yes gene_type:complete
MSTELNILVTEAGGAAGIGLIKSIKKSAYKCRTYAVDCDELAAGRLLADHSLGCPPAESDLFILAIKEIISSHNIDLIIPSGEHDLLKLSQEKDALKQLGCEIFISDPHTISICQNKLDFFNFLQNEGGLLLPLTMQTPFIKKPIKGSGSRGIEITNSEGEIVQEYIKGKEYTVDVFCDMFGNIISHVIRERVAIKAGISVKGKIIKKNHSISSAVKRAVKLLGLKGPSCIQFKLNDDFVPVLIECNPRLGGGTHMATLAGVNCVDIYLDLYTGKEPDPPEPKEITVVRYFEEIVL